MFYRLFLLTLLLSPALLSAECVHESLTENRDDIVYQLPQKTRFNGCIVQAYPDHRKKSELHYKDGKLTGEGTHWYPNGQKESMVSHRDGKIVSKRLWNQMGNLYTFEQYLDGKPLEPIEMDYTQATKACQDATFDGYSEWKLPSISELKRVPFSDTIREKTYIASNTPKKLNGTRPVSYIRFGGSVEEGRWDMKGLDTETPFDVICVRADEPKHYRLVLAIDGEADLSSTYATNDRPAKTALVVTEVSTEQSDITEGESVTEPLMAIAAVDPVAATAAITTAPAVAATPQPSIESLDATPVPPLKSQDDKKEVEEEVSITIRGVMHQEGLREGHYIVIYEFAGQRPSQDRLNKIMLAGYRYSTITVMAGTEKTNYVIIGPFSTTNKVAKELRRVHERVESNAYIITNQH